MTQYNSLNIKFSNSQFNKLKSGIKNGIEISLNLLSNVIGESGDEANFLHKSLLTNTQLLSFCKTSADNSSVNIKLSKTQLFKIGQSGGFLDRILGGSLIKPRFPLMKIVLKLLAK